MRWTVIFLVFISVQGKSQNVSIHYIDSLLKESDSSFKIEDVIFVVNGLAIHDDSLSSIVGGIEKGRLFYAGLVSGEFFHSQKNIVILSYATQLKKATIKSRLRRVRQIASAADTNSLPLLYFNGLRVNSYELAKTLEGLKARDILYINHEQREERGGHLYPGKNVILLWLK